VISAVGIVVPARDEQSTVSRCVAALLVSLRELPVGVEAAVSVVADRCTDDTARVAHEAFGGWAGGRVVANRAERSIGEVRDLGLCAVRPLLTGHRASRTWLLSTDADSTVAPGWVRGHLALARQGVHAVAGVAELAGAEPPGYADVLAGARRPDGHGNVYAANLGVRADAYEAVGGFGAVVSGEDHDLWRRLGEAGWRRKYTAGSAVRTSARRRGRAPGGLADLLSLLDHAAEWDAAAG
jgi:GT2 family glycosyltransferase